MKNILVLLGVFLGHHVFAAKLEAIPLTVYKSTEAIHGASVLPANEAVVDYLATLRRPTGMMKGIKYSCQGRMFELSVPIQMTGPQMSGGWVNLMTVYDLSDCKENE